MRHADAITIVLYTVAKELVEAKDITGGQMALGVASFFTVSLGGLFLGVVCGLLCALFTKFSGELRGE